MTTNDTLAEERPQVVRRDFLQLTAAVAAAALGAQALGAAADSAKTICVLGATGHVGGAILSELLKGGYHVVAVSRSAEKLQRIRLHHPESKALDTLVGDLGSDATADALRAQILSRFGKPYAVVSVLSSPAADAPMRILDGPTDKLRDAFNTNFFSHVTAAVALIPHLQSGGVYVGISGGLSDFVVPNMGALSMTQSALRSLYSVLAKEAQDEKAHDSKSEVRMLALYGLVATDETPGKGDMYLESRQIGARVREVVSDPAAFPGPILSIKAKQFS